MRTLAVALGLITFASCPEQIGDRCGEALPPCPSATACVDGLCRQVTGTDGGVAGGTGGGTSGGLSGGGSGGGVAPDAGEDAGGAFDDAGTDAGGPFADAGTDAGIDAGADGGPARDAGRVLTVILRDLYVQTDGGIDEYPRPGVVPTALFFLPDGGELRIPMTSNDAGVFVAGHAPPGSWMAETMIPGGRPSFFEIDDDQFDLSSTIYRGRPGAPVANMTPLSFNLALQPWGEFDYLELASQSAGSLFLATPQLNPGDVSFTGQSTATLFRGPAIRTDDDLKISQLQTNTLDSGVEVASIVGTATISGVLVPGAVIAATLLPPTSAGRVSVRLDAGFLASALRGPPDSCLVSIAEEIGGTRTSNDPSILFGDIFSETSLDVDVPYQGRMRANGRVLCSRSFPSAVPLSDGGFERSDAGQLSVALGTTISTVDRLDLDGGVVTTPTMTAPEAILVDGQSLPIVHSQSPTVSWDVPLVGNPNRYTVVAWRVTRSGNSIRRESIASLYTTSRQVRIPSGILTRGESYSIQVFGTQAGVPNPSRPFIESLPSSYGATFSAVFVVN